jgi:phage-related protein
MVAIVGEAGVRLRPEAAGFEAEAESGILGPLTGVAKRAAGLFAAAFAAEKVGSFLKESVTQASDLSESTSKVGVVFGDSAQSVLDFAANASTAFGQTRGQALEAAGTFGNLLRSIGLTSSQAADMSTSMVGLASDLASFNNTDPAEALEALRAGLTGETEPLKRYGINLNDATLKAEAMRLGLDTTGSTLSANTKAQAAYSLIMQQSSLAQGDFARTSAGLANQQRIMSSQWQDLQANIGGLFVPALGNAAGLLTGHLMPALLRSTSGLSDLGSTIGAFGDYVRAGFNQDDVVGLYEATGPLAVRMVDLGVNAGVAGGIFTEAFADGKAGADLLASEGLGGLAARAGVAAHHVQQEFGVAFSSLQATASPILDSLAPAFASTWASIRAGAGQAFAGIGATIGEAFGGGGGGGGILSSLSSMLGGALQQAVPVVQGLMGTLGGLLQSWLPIIGDIAAQVGPLIGSLFSQLGPVISALLPLIAQLASFWRDVLLGALQALLPVLPTIINGVVQIAGALISGLLPVITQLAPVIGQVVSALQGALISAIQALVPVIPPLVDAVVQIALALANSLGPILQALMPIFPAIAEVIGQVASMLAGALASALQAIIPILPPIIDALLTVAQALMGALMSALQALLPVIPMIIDALVTFITSAITPLLPILPILANLLATIISALAPIIPVVVQVVALLIQLAISALMPLMPIITIIANLFAMLISALAPVIQIVVSLAGVFIGVFATILSTVMSVIGTVVGIFSGLLSAIGSIFSSIFSVISGVWNSIFGFISGIVSRITGAISGAFSGVVSTISGIFSGIGNIVSGAFDTAVGAVKSAINFVIDIINGAINFINTKLIDTANLVPFVDIPHIPKIPHLHEGGIFEATYGSEEGLALLRSGELVVTPEQRKTADELLSDLLAGRLSAATPAPQPAQPPVQINQEITQLPGEDGGTLAARITQGVVWNLNNGTRPVGATP